MDELPVTRLTRRGERRGRAWVPVARGVARLAETDDPFLAACRAWQAVLPDRARFTHLTGARLRRWWLPPTPVDLPVFVVLPQDAPRIRRPGLVTVRRNAMPVAEVVEGVRVDPPLPTIAAAARHLGELDLTCLVDAALFAQDLTPADLAGGAPPRTPGRPVLSRALAASDHRAESIWEVLLRRLHQVCGVEVEPQHVVHDEFGNEIARGDLWLVGTKELREYDGSDHLERRQQRKDLRRGRRLGRSDWVRWGYTSEDVLHRAVTILADADAAIGREHDPARIRAWHALLRESMFTPAGSTRLRHRLGLPAIGHSETPEAS